MVHPATIQAEVSLMPPYSFLWREPDATEVHQLRLPLQPCRDGGNGRNSGPLGQDKEFNLGGELIHFNQKGVATFRISEPGILGFKLRTTITGAVIYEKAAGARGGGAGNGPETIGLIKASISCWIWQ